jgi:hypothetical protein
MNNSGKFIITAGVDIQHQCSTFTQATSDRHNEQHGQWNIKQTLTNNQTNSNPGNSGQHRFEQQA